MRSRWRQITLVAVAALLGLAGGSGLAFAYGEQTVTTYRILPAAGLGAVVFGWIASRLPRITLWDSVFWGAVAAALGTTPSCLLECHRVDGDPHLSFILTLGHLMFVAVPCWGLFALGIGPALDLLRRRLERT